MSETEPVAAILAEFRSRKLLGYLFAEDPEDVGAWGYVDKPFDRELQEEIALALAHAILSKATPASKEMPNG